MFADFISWITVVILLAACVIMLIHKDWRVSLGALAIQYLGMMWLITLHLPFAMASAKLIVGWMTVAVLGMTRLGLPNPEEEEQSFFPQGILFRIALMGIIVLVTAGATPAIESSIPGLGLPVIAGGLLLIGGGILHLGVSTNILRISLGLLTMLAGFEIIYAAIESAILVAGLLAIINVGLGMVGSYLLLAGTSPLESDEELL